MRPVLFALTGGALFAYWALARPAFEAPPGLAVWPTVLWFSATLALLAAALVAFGRPAGPHPRRRLAALAGAGLLVSSAANVVEDGLGLAWAFAPFVAGEAVALASLVALAVRIAATDRGAARLAAVVPGGTALGLVLFVPAGGPVLLATWLGAAAWVRTPPPPRCR